MLTELPEEIKWLAVGQEVKRSHRTELENVQVDG